MTKFRQLDSARLDAAIQMADLTFAALSKPRVAPQAQRSNWRPLIDLVGEKRAAEFMLMHNLNGIMLYKHVMTRRYLNISIESGQTYRYVPGGIEQVGSYEPILAAEAIREVLG